jgi:hypothetical protein
MIALQKAVQTRTEEQFIWTGVADHVRAVDAGHLDHAPLDHFTLATIPGAFDRP